MILAYVFASPLHDIRLQQALPPNLLVYVTALVAFVAVAVPVLWRICRNVITIAHEGGHALVAVLCGRRLQSIRLRSDTSGLTITKGKPRGPGAILTLAVGYITPSLVGIVGAYLLATHHIRVTLWVSIGLLLVILVMIRNLYGFVAVIATGAAVFAVSWWTSSQVQAAFAYTGVWFLLIGGVRPVFELARQRRQGKANASDVDQLADLSHVPAVLWLGLYVLVTVGALAVGVLLLTPVHLAG